MPVFKIIDNNSIFDKVSLPYVTNLSLGLSKGGISLIVRVIL